MSAPASMGATRLALLTALTMAFFASNSLFCRVALAHTAIDAASFTSLRLASGALMLWVLVTASRGLRRPGGSWLSALALFGYAAAFSFAYLQLSAATGALLVFGALQATMIGYGAFRGERMNPRQWFGATLAFAGLLAMLLPGLTAPPLGGALLMVIAGASFALYSLRGPGREPALTSTAGNFARSLAFTVPLSLLFLDRAALDPAGVGLAVASGALASGLGYALWYTVVPHYNATQAAIIQFSAPPLTALGGVLLLDEALTPRLLICFAAILGGVAIHVLSRPVRPAQAATPLPENAR